MGSPRRSQRRSAAKLNMNRRTLQKILKQLNARSYVIQTTQQLRMGDYAARLEYCSRILALQYDNPSFISNIWYSDECHFHLSGHVNRRSNRFLGFQRPEEVQEIPLHSEKVTVWCAVSGRGIIGPYFIEENGRPATVNQERYITQVLTPFVDDLRRFCRSRNLPFGSQFFQQDGATCHTAQATRTFLRETFGNNVISRFTDFSFPSHSPDLTSLDAFVWGMLKLWIFRDNPPSTIQQLKEKITEAIRQMQQPLFSNMATNMQERYELCVQRNGGHLEHVIRKANT